MHNPPCETWDVHHRRITFEAMGMGLHLEEAVDYALHTWENELLLADADFDVEFQRVCADVRQSQETAA